MPSTPRSTVAPASPPCVKVLDGREESRALIDTFVASHVDREFCRLFELLGKLDRLETRVEQTRALERDEPVSDELAHPRERPLDRGALVDRHGHERKILREREEPVGMERLTEPEPLGRAHQHGGSQLVLLEEIHEGVRQELVPDPFRLAEVDRELEAVVIHKAAPTSHPATAARSPATSEIPRFARAIRSLPSSPSRSVSSIQVEKVV